MPAANTIPVCHISPLASGSDRDTAARALWRAIYRAGFRARNWSFENGRVLFSVYSEGDSFLGCVTLTEALKPAADGRWDRKDQPQLRAILAAYVAPPAAR